MGDKFECRVIPAKASNTHSYVTRKSFGVVARILPWNSPPGTLIWKLAPCLAAGNTVVLKPSEHSSCSTLDQMDLLLDVDLPLGVLNIETGCGATTGALFIEYREVEMASFNGGIAPGRAAAGVAARQMKPYVMELDGEPPQFELADADLDLVVHRLLWASFRLAGNPTPPDRAFC